MRPSLVSDILLRLPVCWVVEEGEERLVGEQLVVEIRKIVPNHLQYGKYNVETGKEKKLG